MSHASGDLIGERYRLGKEIGQGGSATVWEAFDTTLRRRVAAKFLISKHRNRETVERRFLREARIAAAVRHPHVVEVFDFGVAGDTPFMIMELLEGASLAERTTREPLLSCGELLDIIDGVLAGLAAVHDAGIVHRDVKPENVFLATRDDDVSVPKIFDFGVSRIQTGDGSISAATTVEGYLVGTPHYMSSEQARGKKDLDARTDVYSAAVVLYEYLTGRLPFDAELMGDLVIKIATEDPPSVRELREEIGEPLSALIAKAMSKSPDDRFESAAEMRDGLREARTATPELDDLATRLSDRPVEDKPVTADAAPAIPMPWDKPETDFDLPPADVPSGRVPIDVDFDLPQAERKPPPSRPRWLLPAIAAGVGGLAVVAVVLVTAGGGETSEPAPSTQQTSTPPPQTAVLPTTVAVSLRGVPEGAAVLLDGEEVDGTELELAADDEEHRIEVRADGMQRWALVHHGADATYDVALLPLAEVETVPQVPEVEEQPEPEHSTTRRGRSTRGRRGGQAENDDGIFRRLDF